MDSEISNPPGPISLDGKTALEPQLRALQLLQVAYLITLICSVIGGAARAFMMERVMSQGTSYSEIASTMSAVFGVWRVASLIASVMMLIALNLLARSPAKAQASGLARSAFVLSLLALLVSFVSQFAPRFLFGSADSRQLSTITMGISGIETALDFASDVMLLEVLLRLRRFAAPASREVAESEGLVRAAIIGALLARIVVGYGSHFLSAILFSHAGSSQWAGFLMRLPFSLAITIGMLWLLNMTAKALREAQHAAASAQPGEAAGLPAILSEQEQAQAQSSAAYRNVLFGSLWAIGGLALTVFSYQSAASSSGGGRYIVAYGAIIGGVVQLIRGLAQVSARK